MILSSHIKKHEKSKLGLVQGKRTTISQSMVSNTQVNSWLGIPYAEKPINDLRFKAPVPVRNWTGILNTTTLQYSCYQLTSELNLPDSPISKDCLYLNVYAPNLIPTNAAVMVNFNDQSNQKNNHPILLNYYFLKFWIYGGGFNEGSANLYDSSMIVAETGVIVVTVQYRVSIFGFFFVNDTDSSGNQGLLDQNLAL